MSTFKSDLMQVLSERGFIHQASDADGLDELAAREALTGYIGFDCTAPSLHVGSLVQIMMLRWFQRTGHKPVTLMGGGTTRVGDPSGKDQTRQLLANEEIEKNKQSILSVFERFLDYGHGSGRAVRLDNSPLAVMIDNADWLTRLNYIDFLRDVGRHFSVNRMLAMDSVKLRLERDQELSFLEFNYMVLQAYDFVELHRRTGCLLQMGGSDQWGNIVTGIDLGRRMGTPQLYAITSPLITTSSGAKMGKTAQGAVWLNADMVSPYEYWQFWRNIEDADVERFLKLFTELPLDEIAKLAALESREINEAKKMLATEATALLHGREAAEEAAETARRTFEEGTTGDALPTKYLNWSGPKGEWEQRSAAAILRASELVSSMSEARRKITENPGGSSPLRINDEPVRDPNRPYQRQDADPTTGAFKVQLGKTKIALVKPIP